MVAEVVADWEAKQVKPKQGECVVMLLLSSLGQLRPQILMCGQDQIYAAIIISVQI